MKTAVFSNATLANQCDLVSRRITTDPVTGSAWVLTYEGTAYGVELVGASLNAIGGRIEVSENGGKCQLVATFARDPNTASDPTTETPIDKWELDWELVQISIWSIPIVTRELWAYAKDSAGLYNVSAVKKKIVDSVTAGEEYPFTLVDQYPNLFRVYNKLLSGAEFYETKRPVLTRVRTYSESYPSRTRVVQREFVYTTSTLIGTFAVPVDIQNVLPFDPPDTDIPLTTAGTIAGTWSWKNRGERLAYQVATRRFEESMTFAFSAWDNELYEVL
jgi:hypothetical protein